MSWWVYLFAGVVFYIVMAPRRSKPWTWRHTRKIRERRALIDRINEGDLDFLATCDHPLAMKREHELLDLYGLLDPDQPTRWSSHPYRARLEAIHRNRQ